MGSGLNLTSIFVSNGMGLLLLITSILNNKLKFTDSADENKYINWMATISIISMISEPLAAYFDGVPGEGVHTIVYALNLWVYAANILIVPGWIKLITRHINWNISKRHHFILDLGLAILTIILIVNFFCPVVFEVDENNVYSRNTLYMLFSIMELLYMIDGVAVYYRARSKGATLKFFPVWQFILPMVMGMGLQTVFYGTSLIWPSVAVSITTMVSSLQNENTFKDGLTGLYNRSYMDYLKQEMNGSKHKYFTAMMLDLNGFKDINDKYGHAEGDEALIKVGSLVHDIVGNNGAVIRYAGDEFVILFHTQDSNRIKKYSQNIKQAIEDCNKGGDKGYTLSTSIGYCTFNIERESLDEVMNTVDRNMYLDKSKYYLNHPKANRRK